MKINPNKSGILFLDRDSTGHPSAPANNKIRDYPIVTTYKYLGTNITKEFKMSEHITNA
jgi:hypothetical protein